MPKPTKKGAKRKCEVWVSGVLVLAVAVGVPFWNLRTDHANARGWRTEPGQPARCPTADETFCPRFLPDVTCVPLRPLPALLPCAERLLQWQQPFECTIDHLDVRDR